MLIDKKHNKIDIKAMTKNQKRAYLLKLWINREISYNKKSKILLHWHMWIYSQAIFCECKKNELDIQEIKRVAFILIDKIILFLYKVKNKQYDPQELLLYFENTLNSSLGRVPQIFIIM